MTALSISTVETLQRYFERHGVFLHNLGDEQDGHDPKTVKQHFPMEEEMLKSLEDVARQTGMQPGFWKARYALGNLILDGHQLDYIVDHLTGVRKALQVHGEVPQAGREELDLSKFAVGTLSRGGASGNYPALQQLFETTHLLGFVKGATAEENRLYALIEPRNDVMQAMAIIRPDLVDQMHQRMSGEQFHPGIYGSLSMTSPEIDEFQKSYQKIANTMLHEGPAAAMKAVDTMHRHYLIRRKPPVAKREHVVPPQSSEIVRGEDNHVKLSRREPKYSVDSFMVPMASLDPVFDLLDRLQSVRNHPDGIHGKYLSSRSEYHMLFTSDADAKNAQQLLRQLLNDGNAIRVEATTQQHKTQHWLVIPADLYPSIIDEASMLTTFLSEAADQFMAGDRDKAEKSRTHLMDYMQARGFAVGSKHQQGLASRRGSDSGSQSVGR